MAIAVAVGLSTGCAGELAPEDRVSDEELIAEVVPVDTWTAETQALQSLHGTWGAGDFTVADAFPTAVVQVSADRCEITLAAQFVFTGDVTGAFDAVFDIVHFGNCADPAFETFVATGGFEGTINGATGTFTFVFPGTIDPNRPIDQTAAGVLFVDDDSGTEGLEGIDGVMLLIGQAGVAGEYLSLFAGI